MLTASHGFEKKKTLAREKNLQLQQKWREWNAENVTRKNAGFFAPGKNAEKKNYSSAELGKD
jgi:hypothetical protein